MAASLVIPVRQNSLRTVMRAVDVIGAILGLVFLSPLFAAVSLLIALDSRGSVFFRQERVGQNGRPFTLVKFRTMHTGSGEIFQEYLASSPELRLEFAERQKLAHDPRLTRAGELLRRTSLDELPQLWNVLRGEMSLVGPRPILPRQANLYGPAIQLYIQVRPGMTGLWQVSGRNELSFRERVDCDVSYLVHWSIWLDLAILIRTPWMVLSQRGAC